MKSGAIERRSSLMNYSTFPAFLKWFSNAINYSPLFYNAETRMTALLRLDYNMPDKFIKQRAFAVYHRKEKKRPYYLNTIIA